MKNKYKNMFKYYDALFLEMNESIKVLIERINKLEEKKDITKTAPLIKPTKNLFLNSKKLNEHKSLIFCPYHEEKSPSCVVDTKERKYYCLSCGTNGGLDQLGEEI
jgi:hypothetical protein